MDKIKAALSQVFTDAAGRLEIKMVLGVRAAHVMTPRQLHKHLARRAYIP